MPPFLKKKKYQLIVSCFSSFPGEPGEYYIPGITPIVKSLITGLERHCDIKGRNVSMDRLYTNIELFEWLLARKITGLGTIMMNRKGLPDALKTTVGRDNHSYSVLWEKTEEKLSLHSYVVKPKSSKKKNVLMLSSFPPLLGTTKDDNHSKPAIMKLYDFTKGGTDIMDQRIGSYTTNSKSVRWVSTAFSYMLDTMRVN